MKEELRNVALANRNAVSLLDKNEMENQIVQHLLPLIEDKKMIGIYLPKEKEVDISSLLFYFKEVGVPKVRNDIDMDFFLIKGLEDVETGYFNVLEPTTNIWIDPSDLEAILVPMVAFDEKCNRLGYGKGYYDQYLKNCNCIKIGIAFDCQKCDSIPIEETDIKMDCIVTEKKVYQ